MGILKDAGVDPADAAAEPAPPAGAAPAEAPSPEEAAASGSVWREMKAVFTTSERRREFLRFLKKGLRE